MTEEKKKIPRLGKAAGEFNVGISSIVLLLKKKGITMDENPNNKLTPEIYDILIQEFNIEKKVKLESQKINLGGFAKAKMVDEQPTVTPQPVAAAPDETEKPEMEDVPVEIPTEYIAPEEEKPTEVVVEPVEKIGPKIIGKIELEEKKPKKKKSAEPKKKTAEETPVEIPTEEPVKTEIVEKPIAEPKVPEHIPTVHVQTPSLKIVDKIDLSELESHKGRKSKKSQKPVEQKPVEVPIEIEPTPLLIEEPQVVTTQKPPERIIEHIETKVEKLQAPKIMGKIDLPVERPKEHKKEDKASEHREKKNKKRKRIKAPVVKSDKDDARLGKKKTDTPKEDISQEDIDKQIRETMQRLEPLGKSKTSKRRREKRQNIQQEMMEVERQEIEDQKRLQVTEFITANELATLMNVPVNKIIATCMSIGLAVSINQRLDAETISLLTDEFGYEVKFVGAESEEEKSLEIEDNPEDLEPRHPIITVMGHVDHGKTSLLDYIRKSNVIAGEAGGITQHIGAYEVSLHDGRKITFLDTPGHEAFTAMRARGAKVTDLSIIVIAADDSVMPQTVEAINHAQAAGVPMVFAITKIDKPNANPEKIKEGLANMNILVEDWGGNYQCQEIDAKHGTNVNELLEKLLLEAELLELKANPNRNGVGTVIESSLDKGKGYVAKMLVQNGNIKVGDPVLSGSYYGRVKTLYNERNQPVKSAGPATPVLLLGLNGAPQAGEVFKVMPSEHDARIAANKRAQLTREMGLRTQKHITLDEIGRRIAIGDFKELNLIVKGDVDGSVEALADSLLKLSTEQVQVNVIHKAVGAVTEGDVILASASNAIILAFQVRPSLGSRKLAEQEQIDIRTYSIIYDAINEIKDAIAGMHTPEIKEKIVCNLEIKEVFKITKVGNVAGCIVLDGKILRNTKIHLIRDGIVIHTGKLGSLKRFKDDVKEVYVGQDCGLNIDNYNDIKVGDIIEGFEEYEEKISL